MNAVYFDAINSILSYNNLYFIEINFQTPIWIFVSIIPLIDRNSSGAIIFNASTTSNFEWHLLFCIHDSCFSNFKYLSKRT